MEKIKTRRICDIPYQSGKTTVASLFEGGVVSLDVYAVLGKGVRMGGMVD